MDDGRLPRVFRAMQASSNSEKQGRRSTSNSSQRSITTPNATTPSSLDPFESTFMHSSHSFVLPQSIPGSRSPSASSSASSSLQRNSLSSSRRISGSLFGLNATPPPQHPPQLCTLFINALESESILFTAPVSVNEATFMQVKHDTAQKTGPSGSVLFEVIERVAQAPLRNNSFDRIYSNLFLPTVSVHTPMILSRYLATLKNDGQLLLQEPILLQGLSNTVCPISRKSDELVSLLKLAGFVHVTVRDIIPVTDQDLREILQLWGVSQDRLDRGMVSRLSGKVALIQILARKPAYNVGQKMALNFKKKSPTTATSTKAEKKQVWLINTNDDGEGIDMELENEDGLLDEEDKIKPSKASLARPDDCSLTDGKRKACKGCTCGREEGDEEEQGNVAALELMEDIEQEVIEVDPTPKENSGCGSCSLGDAFRCSTCPYMGMPAFNEGDKIKLGGMFEIDDIDDF
ncbi:anamorsin [Mucor ambiguus]|uniref:Anamorsin n=1 Tax=Mucor ambiguus TaxID=91626 RepID=A0A0C9MSC7_9FUNG|nr:anamorsin [Mucor ambiguus]